MQQVTGGALPARLWKRFMVEAHRGIEAHPFPGASSGFDLDGFIDSLFRGGGPIHPGHVVGAFNDTTDRWDLRATRNGSDGPNDGKWGDYLGINRYSNRGNSWFASGYTLQGGGNRSDIDPQVVQFGFRG